MNFKKIFALTITLMVLAVSISAASAEDWSFNFSSEDSSNSDGGDFKLDNGVLTLQGVEFEIPEGYKENESARKLAVPTDDIEGAKCSLVSFLNGDKEILLKVFFVDDGEFTDLHADESEVNQSIGDVQGLFAENKFGDNTPSFRFIKDGQLIEIDAPDMETLNSLVESAAK